MSPPLFQLPVNFRDGRSFVLFSSRVIAPISATHWPVAGVKCVCCMEAGFGEPHKAEMSQTSLAATQAGCGVEERLEPRVIVEEWVRVI